MSDRQRLSVALLLLALVAVSGWWLWERLAGSITPAPPAAMTATMAPHTAAAPATASPLRAPSGYRLAGVAVGEPDSFAVVEAPNGVNSLYRANAEIPGLGRLVRIEAERVVVQSDAGPLELWLMPASTPTPTRVRTPTARATAAPRSPTPKPQPPAGASTPGSRPSAAPGSPAS